MPKSESSQTSTSGKVEPLSYEASPTVLKFLTSDERRRCIVGPFGSGKSSGCDVEIARRMLAQRPGTDGVRRSRFVIVRNTYTQLRDTARRTFDAWLGRFGEWREQPLEFRARTKQVDCEVLFRALDRPKDVRNLLSLDVTGAYFNELREISKDIWDGMDARVGRYPATKDGGCSWEGMWADSNPWHTGHWADKFFAAGATPETALFRQPSGLAGDAENLGNLPGGRAYYERMCQGKSQEYIDVYVHGLNGTADEGSVFGKWIERLKQRGGVGEFAHPPNDIFTSWDLGLADSTAIFWWRVTPRGVEVLDWYENQNEDLEHYFEEIDGRALPPGQYLTNSAGKVIEGRGWSYVKHWLPHDAAQRTLAAGTSVMNRFLQRYGASKVAIGPNLDVADGIEAGRWLLQQPGTRFHARTAPGLERLSEYRFLWNDKMVTYSSTPCHDRASHTGDAWRYVAVSAKVTGLIMQRPEPQKRVEVGGLLVRPPGVMDPLPRGAVQPSGKLNVTIAELFAEHDRRRR